MGFINNNMENILDFDNYILESNSIFLMDPETKSTLLKLDEKYHKLIEKFRTKYVAQTVSNIKEEFDKFMNAKSLGQKYYPQLEIKNSDVDMKIYDDMGKLKEEFEKIKDKCYVAKFYLEKLHSMMMSLEQRQKLENGTYEPGENPVDKELYKEALQVIKDNPYKKPDFKKDRTNDSDDVLEAIEDALDELGYDFDVEIDTGMLPRMNVKMGKVNINKTSKFSDEDIEGLIAHEIKGHVGRRFYGKKTGLWLFAYGTQSSSTYDEGLAVWNSLNKVKHKKDNVMFNIAMKTCVSYLMFEMDFCDLFDWVKKKAPGMTDYTAFKTVMRPRRRNKDCEIKSGEPMTTYFQGWKMVNDMDDQMRDDILHYNIGPDQKYELENIKEFLKVNKFKPLK
jgi:hypothetical protein